MKRSDMIQKLAALYEDIPRKASSYHIVDILLRKAERLGMLPPPDTTKTYYSSDNPGGESPHEWEGDEDL